MPRRKPHCVYLTHKEVEWLTIWLKGTVTPGNNEDVRMADSIIKQLKGGNDVAQIC